MAKRKQKDVLPPDAVVTETIPKTFTLKVTFGAEELREAATAGEDLIYDRLVDLLGYSVDLDPYCAGCSVALFGHRYYASLSSDALRPINRFYDAYDVWAGKKYNPKPLTLNLTFNMENY